MRLAEEAYKAVEAEKRRLAEEANKVIEAKEVIEDASHGGQVAHGERMEKGEDAAAAAEKVEDGDKDSTIVLSDEEVEQFVTVKKRTKQKEEKEIKHRDTKYCDPIKTTYGWKCRICDEVCTPEKLCRIVFCRLRPRDK